MKYIYLSDEGTHMKITNSDGSIEHDVYYTDVVGVVSQKLDSKIKDRINISDFLVLFLESRREIRLNLDNIADPVFANIMDMYNTISGWVGAGQALPTPVPTATPYPKNPDMELNIIALQDAAGQDVVWVSAIDTDIESGTSFYIYGTVYNDGGFDVAKVKSISYDALSNYTILILNDGILKFDESYLGKLMVYF